MTFNSKSQYDSCDRLQLIKQEKQKRKDTKTFNEGIFVIFDNLLENKGNNPIPHNKKY